MSRVVKLQHDAAACCRQHASQALQVPRPLPFVFQRSKHTRTADISPGRVPASLLQGFRESSGRGNIFKTRRVRTCSAHRPKRCTARRGRLQWRLRRQLAAFHSGGAVDASSLSMRFTIAGEQGMSAVRLGRSFATTRCRCRCRFSCSSWRRRLVHPMGCVQARRRPTSRRDCH